MDIKRMIGLMGLFVLCSGSGLAAQGTIRETDTAIIIEYIGDPEPETPVSQVAPPAPAAPQPQAPPIPSPPPAAPLTADATKQEGEAAPPGAARPDHPRRQLYEAKIAQRAAQRERELQIRRQQQTDRKTRRMRESEDD